MEKEKMQCSLSGVTFSSEPNKMIITGCVAKIGEASTGIPCGPVDKPVVFTSESVKKCAVTFEGSPLNCVFPDGWGDDIGCLFMGHSGTNIGFLRKVYASGDNLMSEIVVWKDRNYDLANLILMSMDSLGFSLEWYTTAYHEEDETIYIDEFEGCGCALVWRDAAAFSQTFIGKIAAAKKEDKAMTKEEKQEIIKEISDMVTASIDEKVAASVSGVINEGFKQLSESINPQMSASIEESFKNIIKQITDEVADIKSFTEKFSATSEEISLKASDVGSAENDDLNSLRAKVKAQAAEIGSLKAAAAMPTPKTAQTVAKNPAMGDEKQEKIAKINASGANFFDRLREITKVRCE